MNLKNAKSVLDTIIMSPAAMTSIILLLGFLLMIAGFVGSSEFQLERKGAWSDPPEIFICQDFNLTPNDVESAISFWTDLGHQFGYIADDLDCYDNKFIYGAIVIGLPTSGYDYTKLGRTLLVDDSESNSFEMARVEISYYTRRVLIHELGHTLGYDDVEIEGHIMNPNNLLGGWDSSGLRVFSNI